MPGAAVAPSVNKGLKSLPASASVPEAAFLDFLTFTVSAIAVKSLFPDSLALQSGYDAQHEQVQHEIASILVAHFGLAVALKLDGNRGGFRSFYDHHFKLYTPDGDVCGMVAFGGERQRWTTMIQLTGAGCAHVQAWATLRKRAEQLKCRITRVDVAHDDYEGVHTVADAIRWHAEGLFTTAGRPPALQVVGWDDGSGKTVYIGKNADNQSMRVYEKGREQGARDGDPTVNWVRWEAQFGAKYREIPWDIVTDPVGYLVGHYPVMKYWIDAVCSRMRTARDRAVSNLAHSVRWARRQYGGLLHLLVEHLPEPEKLARFISRHVAKTTPPPWLKANPFGAFVIAEAVEGRLELAT